MTAGIATGPGAREAGAVDDLGALGEVDEGPHSASQVTSRWIDRVDAESRPGPVPQQAHEPAVAQGVAGDEVGFQGDYAVETINLGIHEPDAWERVETLIAGDSDGVAYVLASGDDSLNLRTALRVAGGPPALAGATDEASQTHQPAMVVARTFHRSDFNDAMANDGGFHVVNTAELLLERFERERLLD